MKNMYTPSEITVLETNYRLTFMENSSFLSTQAILLLDDHQLKSYLTAVKEKTKAANLSVAASLFVKRYSFSVLIALYSMSMLNKRIHFSVDNVSIQTLDESDQLWLPSIKFNQINGNPAPQVVRNNWRTEILQEIFAEHIDIVFNQLNKISKLPKIIMWENLYIYIVWMYETLLSDCHDLNKYQHIKDDFDMITMIGKGLLFGEYNENPFLKFRGTTNCQGIGRCKPHTRKTCCLSYLAETTGHFCKNCPIKKKKESKSF